MQIGYARVSTGDQSLDVQIEALKAAGCETIRSEKVSGTSLQGREELETILSFLRQDDVLVVVKIDRLARSISDLMSIVKRLRERGASLRTVDGVTFDDSAMGRCFLQMLGVFADSDEVARAFRDDGAHGFRHDVAQGVTPRWQW